MFLGGGDSDLLDENKDNAIISLSHYEQICLMRVCFERCFSQLHGFMKHSLKANFGYQQGCSLACLMPITGQFLNQLETHRGKVPKPTAPHSGISIRNLLNLWIMCYPILLLFPNYPIILWKLKRQMEIFLCI